MLDCAEDKRADDLQMVDFDKALKMKGKNGLEEMWAIISAIGLWANVEDVSELISTHLVEDATRHR